MPIYEYNGKKYNIPEEIEQQFIADVPDAKKLVEPKLPTIGAYRPSFAPKVEDTPVPMRPKGRADRIQREEEERDAFSRAGANISLELGRVPFHTVDADAVAERLKQSREAAPEVVFGFREQPFSDKSRAERAAKQRMQNVKAQDDARDYIAETMGIKKDDITDIGEYTQEGGEYYADFSRAEEKRMNKELDDALTKQGDALYQQVGASLQEKMNKINPYIDITKIFLQDIGTTQWGAPQNRNSYMIGIDDEQTAVAYAAARALSLAKGMQDAAHDDGMWGNFIEGALSGLAEAGENMTDAKKMNDAIETVVKKWEEGGETTKLLNDDEKMLLDALAYQTAVASMYQDKISTSYNVGKTVGAMAPFAVEFLVNPASGLGRKAASQFGKYALKRFAKNTANKYARSAIYNTGRGLGRIGGSVAGGAVMTATTGLPKTVIGVQERMLGRTDVNYADGKPVYAGQIDREEFLPAVKKEVAKQMLEYGSEMLGAGYLDDMFTGVNKLFKGTKLQNWVGKITSGRRAQSVKKFFEHTGWNGPIEEFLEEVHVGYLEPYLVGDNTHEDFFNKDNLIEVALGVAIPGVAVSTAKTVAGAADGSFRAGAQERWKMEHADRRATELWGNWAEWKDLRNSLMVSQPEEIEAKLKEIANSTKLTDSQKMAAIDFGIYSLQYRTARGVADAMTEGRRKEINSMLHELYYSREVEKESGYNAQPDEMSSVQDVYEDERARVLETLGEDVVARLDEDPIGTLADMNEYDVVEASAYVNAKARRDGMLDRISDDIDERIKASDKEIDQHANKGDGMIHPAMMRGVNGATPKRVYIVNGNVATFEDGTIDKANSSSMIIVRDAETGEVSAASADDLESLDAVIDTEAEKRTVAEQIASQYAMEQAGIIDGELPFNVGDVYQLNTEAEGTYEATVISVEGDNVFLDVNGQQVVDTKANINAQAKAARLAALRETRVATEIRESGKPVVNEVAPIPTEKVGKEERAAYHLVPIERTMEDLHDGLLNQNEVQALINARIKEAQDEVQALEKKKPTEPKNPVMGASKEAYLAAKAKAQEEFAKVKAQWDADMQSAQQKLSYYNELNAREQEITRSDIGEAYANVQPVEVVETTPDEFIANHMPKITPESFKRETGLSNSEQSELVGYISGKEKGGVTIEQAAEGIMENYGDELRGLGFNGDVQDVRDMIIGILSNGNPRSYAKKGLDQRKQASIDQQRAEMGTVAVSLGFESVEDMQAYEEQVIPGIIQMYTGFDYNEYYNNLAENYKYDTTRESEAVGRGGELLQGEQSIDNTGTPVAEGNEGGTVPSGVPSNGENAQTSGNEQVTAPVGGVTPTAEEIADAQAFADASAQNTVEAYQDYLDNHPEGAYRDGARAGMWMIEGINPETHGRNLDARNAANAVLARVEAPQATNKMQEAELTEDVKTEDVNQSENNLEMVVPAYRQAIADAGIIETGMSPNGKIANTTRPATEFDPNAESEKLSHVQAEIVRKKVRGVFERGGSIQELHDAVYSAAHHTNANVTVLSYLYKILDAVKAGKVSVEHAMDFLEELMYVDDNVHKEWVEKKNSSGESVNDTTLSPSKQAELTPAAEPVGNTDQEKPTQKFGYRVGQKVYLPRRGSIRQAEILEFGDSYIRVRYENIDGETITMNFAAEYFDKLKKQAEAMMETDLENAEKGEKGQKAVEPVEETDSSTLSQTSDQVGEQVVDNAPGQSGVQQNAIEPAQETQESVAENVETEPVNEAENANTVGDEQAQGTEGQSAEVPYSIAPAQYTTKKGKVLDMHLVKFTGELTKEQQRAAKELAKADKGWYDREKGGFMMRTEESAKRLADTILNNEEAVSEAQPVSITDIQALNNGDVLFTEPQQTESGPVWQYSVHVDKDGYTTISRDDVSGGYPVGDARFRHSTNSPEEMLDILRNPLNGMQEVLDAVGVTLENKIKTRELDRKAKEEREQKREQLRANGVNGYKIGDKVVYTPASGTREPILATIHDFEEYGDNRPVLDVGMAPVMYEVAEWNTVSKAEETGNEPKQVKVESLFNALNTKGEARLSDHVEQQPATTSNRLVTDERYNELKERMKKKLKGQMNIGIDPEILAIGTEMAVYHLEKGARKFAEFAKAMVADLGDAIRPYLKAFYNGARELPEVIENGLSADMTTYDEVQTFDVANFDKPGIDALATAETVARETEVAKEVDVAKERIKKSRQNKDNKKNSVTSQQEQLNLFENGAEGENAAADNSGAQPGREELPDTEQVGAGVPVQDTARNSKSKRRNAGVGSSELGNGPQYDVNRNYTNEEIETIVSSVTDIVDGKVVITGEVTDDIKAIIRGYESGGIAKKGRGILDEYYTDGKIVDAVNLLIAPYFSGSTPIRVLEPSVGIGNFIQAVNNIPTSEVVAFEINETTARIAKILYPDVDVNLRSFETEFIDESGNKKPMPQKYSLVIGNPPYGSHRGLYKGLGEESKIARYEDYFVKRSLDVLDEGGVLAMVLPSSWMDRHTKFGGYTIERAYRLPSGAFEATQVGTDIVILKKDSSVPVTEHAPYFEQFPERVLGEVKQRKGRYGRLEEYVEGDIDAAIEAIKKENAEQVADLLDIEKNNDALNDIESAVDETGGPEKAVAIVKDAQESEKAASKREQSTSSLDAMPSESGLRNAKADKKPAKKPSGKQGKYKVELNRGVETVPTSAQFTHEFSEGEVEAFADTDYEGALSNPAKHRRYANYIGGQAIHDFYYAEGDIYSKLAQLEQEKDYIVENYSVEQYEKQKALLESVLPKQKSLEEITISPNTTFVKNLNILTEGGRVSLKDMFVDFLRKLPHQAFGNSSSWEVVGYINNEQVHGTDKQRNQLIRERRKRVANDLFNKFLGEELSDNAKKQVVAAFNREYNSTYRPDYSKVPMFSTINRDFKGKPLKLTSVQLAGVGRMTVKGVGVLAHEVGFGKTLSGILAMHEAMTRGFAEKPLIVVPNDNILKQWVETIGEVLPNATVNTLGNLGAGYDLTDFKVNDGEFTIITYEGLKAMSFSDGTYNHLASKFSYITEDLNKHQSERDIQKEIEKKNELKGKMKRGTKSSYMFEDFGFDWLTVDEVHNANHIVSKVRLDKSVASDFRSQSQRTSDLGLKTWLAAQYIQEENNGRNVLLLSATPFTNKPLEYYSILSLVGNDMLERKGFFNVDQFFATFMEADNELEIGANGRPMQKTNVRRFRNNGLFQQLLSEFIDIKGEEDNPELVRPERLNKEYKIAQNELTAEAMAAAQELLSDNDTVLQGIGHARAAAFSPYATSLLGRQPKNHKEFVKNSPKIDATIKMIEQNIKDRPDAGQIIYSEVGVEYFPLIRDYLVKESGLKPSEVRIITGATSNNERVNIQTAFNNGEVKVVIGSPAIKEGLNLQGNTTDMYILSLPWNFTQLRQIEGRGWRQGNRWENIRINYMLTNDSVDVFMLQRLQLKQGLYNEAMKSGAESLDVSDIDTAELKTALITDPAVRAEIVTVQEREKLQLEKTQIEADLSFVMRKYEAYNKLVEKLGSQKNTIKMYREWAKKGDEYWAQRIPREEAQLANIENEIEEEKQNLLKKGVNVDDIVRQTEQAQNTIAAIDAKIENLKEFQEELTQKFREESEAKAKEQGDMVSTYIKERKAENKGGFYKIRPQETETKVAEEETEDDVLYRSVEDTEEVNEKFNEQLDSLTEENADTVELSLGTPSPILKAAGVMDMPMKLYGSKVIKKMKKHGFKLEELKDLPNAVADPIAVFNNHNKEGNRAILTELMTADGNFLVTIDLGDGTDVDFNIVSSVFGKSDNKIVHWFNKGFATYINKEKALDYLHLSAPIAEASDKPELSSAAKIVENFENPTVESKNLTREGAGPLTDREVVMESDLYSKVLGKPRYYGKRQREFVARQRRRMAEKARQVAEKLNLNNVEVLESTEGLTGKKATSKGWFDPRTGKITVVVPNHGSIDDIVETVLHEAVAHYGLRKLFGENFKNFLDNVYNNVTPEIRAEITELAKKRGWDFHTATEEYLASLAENTNFEKVNPSVWRNIKSFFMKMLAKVGITLDKPLGDNELRYILWRSHQNLVNPGWFNVFGQAEDIAKQYELGVGNYASGEVKTENGEVAAEDEIRFSKVTPEMDAEYMTAVENGDMETAERLVKEAAKLAMPDTKVVDRKGFPKVVYHGTKRGGFTTFKPSTESKVQKHTNAPEQSYWFVDNKNKARTYSGTASNVELGKDEFTTGVYPVFLDIRNPKTESFAGEYWDERPGGGTTDDVVNKALSEGKDGAIIYDVVDEGEFSTWEDNKPNDTLPYYAEGATDYVAFSPNQIKSADAVTYDDNGNVIPLSERFNEEMEDIRFREGGVPGSARKEYERKVRRPNESGSVKARENFARRAQEAYHDSMLALKILQDAVARETGNEVKDNENAYIAENRMSSSNKAMVEIYERDFFMPLMDKINALIKEGVEYDDIIRYLHAKHGLERNEYMRRKQAEEAARRELGEEPAMPNEGDADYEAKVNAKAAWRANLAELTESYVKKFAKRDYSGLTALTKTANAKDAEVAAQQMVDEFEKDHDTTPLWKAVNKATKETLRREFVGGLIDRATYDSVSTMFDFYIPLRGWDKDVAANEYEYFTNNNAPVFTPAIKTMRGRPSLSDDPIATIGYMAGSAIARANRNLMKQKFLNFVMNNPTSLATVSEQWYTMDYGTNEWRPDNPAIPEDATPEQIVAIVEAHEANMRALEKAGFATRKRGGLKIGLHATKQEQQQHVVRVMRNGKEYAVYINGNPRAAQALNGMTNPDVSKSKLREAAQIVKNFMARVFTSKNPAFMVTNLSRDVIWAGTAVAAKEDTEYTKQYTKNVTGVLVKFKLPRLVRKFQNGTLDMNNEVEKYFDEFLRNGGETGFTQVLTVEDYKKNIKRFTKEAKKAASVLGKVGRIPKKGWRSFWNGVEFLNRSAEDITRFTVYMTSRQMGRSIARSVYDAKEITVNFNKKGSGEMGAKYLNFAYIFFNATIQSLANFGRLMARHPGKMAAMLGTFGMMGFLMPVINAALMALGDDDDMENYWNLPEWVRRNNIVLFVPWTEKGFITIPLPHEIRPFYGMGENAMSALQGKQTTEDAIVKSLVGFTGMLPIDFTANGGNVVVNLTPTILQPVAQVMANVTHFGTPIYKDNDFNKKYPNWTKAYKGTNSSLVAATKWLNELGGGNNVESGGLLDWNPAVIEHLFESYLGGTGKTFNKMATTVSMIWDEEARIARNIPVASSFYQESDERTAGSQLNREYFDALEEMDDVAHRLSGYRKEITRGNAEYEKMINDLVNSDEFMRYGIIKDYSNTISELNQVLKNNNPAEEEAQEIEGVIQKLKKEMLDELEKLQAEE